MKKMTEEQARTVLRDYPDADLSAFEIESEETTDALAAEELQKTLARLDAKWTGTR